jgi:hypothetical protein
MLVSTNVFDILLPNNWVDVSMLLGVEGVIVFWRHTPFGRHNLCSGAHRQITHTPPVRSGQCADRTAHTEPARAPSNAKQRSTFEIDRLRSIASRPQKSSTKSGRFCCIANVVFLKGTVSKGKSNGACRGNRHTPLVAVKYNRQNRTGNPLEVGGEEGDGVAWGEVGILARPGLPPPHIHGSRLR